MWGATTEAESYGVDGRRRQKTGMLSDMLAGFQQRRASPWPGSAAWVNTLARDRSPLIESFGQAYSSPREGVADSNKALRMRKTRRLPCLSILFPTSYRL